MPGDLPSTRISRCWTTTASATAGLVTAMRMISKSVRNTVDRPAVSTTRSTCPGSCAGGCGRAGTGVPCGVLVAARAVRGPTPGSERGGMRRAPRTRQESSTNDLFGPLRGADGFDLPRFRRGRRPRSGAGSGSRLGARASRHGRRAANASSSRGARGLDAGRRSVGSVSSGLRRTSMIWPSACASVIRSASVGDTISVTTVDGIGGLGVRSQASPDPGACRPSAPERCWPPCASYCPKVPADRDEHIDARSGDDEAGHADDVVYPNRHRSHAARNRRRQTGAGVHRGELVRRDGLVLEHRR